MKIVFWSNVRGQCGTTLHVTCMAVIQALFEKQRVVLMENHDHLIGIETCLVKSKSDGMVMESIRGYNSFGLENLMERFSNIEPGTEEKWIRRCAMSFAHDRLFYLPHGYLRNRDLLDYEFGRNLLKLFNSLESYFDTVYIDTFASESLSTKSIIENADIVVVNLNQNSSVLDHFFRNFTPLREKAFYLLGNYYSGSRNNICEIRRKYQIPTERIFAIPFCIEAAESEADGCLANFIARNYTEPSIDNKEFIEALQEAYRGIINYSSSVLSFDGRGLSFI